MIDQFAIAYEVVKHWLPFSEETGNARENVMRALSRPQVNDPAKQPRRLTVGWFVATADGGYHSLTAETSRPLSNRVVKGSGIEEVLGDRSIETPTVVVKLAKAGLSTRNFQPSYGDILRINEAGNPCRMVDLSNVRLLTKLTWRVKPSGKWLYEAKRAIASAAFGEARPLSELSRPPFDDDPGPVLKVIDRLSHEDISYAIAFLIKRTKA